MHMHVYTYMHMYTGSVYKVMMASDDEAEKVISPISLISPTISPTPTPTPTPSSSPQPQP